MNFNKRFYPSLFALAIFLSACSPPAEPVTAPAPSGGAGAVQETVRQAAVAMPDEYSAEISAEIIHAGGNAVDAAIAAGFALAVTYPEAGNIGGGGFMLIHMDGENVFLDYREVAPLDAHRDMYLDGNGGVIEGSSLVGYKAAGVPGTVAGFWAAHQRFGTLPWQDLVMPAAKLAEEGFVVDVSLDHRRDEYREPFVGKTNFDEHFGGMADGVTFRQPELAATLRRIAEQGASDFYSGETAGLLVAEMERGGGLINAADLEGYNPPGGSRSVPTGAVTGSCPRRRPVPADLRSSSSSR